MAGLGCRLARLPWRGWSGDCMASCGCAALVGEYANRGYPLRRMN
ncbi:hypothetical protein PLANPX_0313 [Lacipirellula parvula]|uniref:Uncharacterized protein n=1 Tax=Lacipirellula parvula TaxID=2650471 RepID=A0A5K7X7J8_9BACT|nr:hypothetical protein PLANPX_0313 [Lacipirellula parvula]